MSSARRTNLFFLGMLVFYLISVFFIIPVIPREYLGENMSIVLGQMIIAIPVVFYLIVTKGAVLKEVKFSKIGTLNTILLIVLTYCILPVVSLINSISMMFAKNYIGEQMSEMNDNPFLLNIFLIAVMPAVIEEIAFRGIIYNGYKKSTIKKAMLTSGLLFGLFHMNVNQFCYAFVMGIFFIFVYEATGSIHSTMIMHFIFNANSVVMLKLVDLFQKYVNKMAETDEAFKQYAEEINSATVETVNYAELTFAEKAVTIFPIFIFAVIGGILGYFILKLIAKNLGRSFHLKQIVYSFRNKRAEYGFYDKEQYVETASGEFGGKIVDFVFITGIIICICMMVV